jgi:hypothetical protein
LFTDAGLGGAHFDAIPPPKCMRWRHGFRGRISSTEDHGRHRGSILAERTRNSSMFSEESAQRTGRA